LKISRVIETYVGDPADYFLAVARLVMMEAARRQAQALDLMPSAVGSEDVSDKTHSCLERCLDQLSESNRDLILQYYAFEKRGKAARHRELAQSLGLSSNALRIRVYKIRQKLEACVKECLKDKKLKLKK